MRASARTSASCPCRRTDIAASSATTGSRTSGANAGRGSPDADREVVGMHHDLQQTADQEVVGPQGAVLPGDVRRRRGGRDRRAQLGARLLQDIDRVRVARTRHLVEVVADRGVLGVVTPGVEPVDAGVVVGQRHRLHRRHRHDPEELDRGLRLADQVPGDPSDRHARQRRLTLPGRRDSGGGDQVDQRVDGLQDRRTIEGPGEGERHGARIGTRRTRVRKRSRPAAPPGVRPNGTSTVCADLATW